MVPGVLLLMGKNLREPIVATDDASLLLTVPWPVSMGASNDPRIHADVRRTNA